MEKLTVHLNQRDLKNPEKTAKEVSKLLVWHMGDAIKMIKGRRKTVTIQLALTIHEPPGYDSATEKSKK